MGVKHLLRHKSIASTQRYILRMKKTAGPVDALDAWPMRSEVDPGKMTLAGDALKGKGLTPAA